MKTLRLVRVTEYNNATLGVLCIDEAPECVTLEDVWRNNEKSISCIPVGRYPLKLHRSPKFGLVYRVENVPERSDILIHAGNTHKDTHGCILLGMQYGKLGTESAVLASKSAFLQFMDRMGNTPDATLIVIDAYGGGRVH
jgi:hypothetical protein